MLRLPDPNSQLCVRLGCANADYEFWISCNFQKVLRNLCSQRNAALRFLVCLEIIASDQRSLIRADPVISWNYEISFFIFYEICDFLHFTGWRPNTLCELTMFIRGNGGLHRVFFSSILSDICASPVWRRAPRPWSSINGVFHNHLRLELAVHGRGRRRLQHADHRIALKLHNLGFCKSPFIKCDFY